MKPSQLELVEKLKSSLLKVPEIVSSFSNKKPDALTNWLNWLIKTENLLKQHDHATCAKLAGLRAEIIGLQYTPGSNRRNLKKQKLSVATSTIQPAQEIVSNLYDSKNEKIEEVRTLIRQIIIPAKEAGLINYNAKDDFTDYLESLLNQFKQHAQLSPLISRAIATIGKYDVLRLLAEEIDLT